MKFSISQQDVTRTLIRLWKPEERARKWKPIPDTDEAIEAAIRDGAMFLTTMAFDYLPEPGKPEPTRYGPMCLDFDDEQHPENALVEMRALCLVHLPEYYGIDPNCIEFFASGSKGFHAIIPAECFGLAGDTHLPLAQKLLVSGWITSLNLKTVDLSIYCMGLGRMFRIPNVRRPNGKFKIPLSIDEVMRLPIDEINRLTMAPREVEAVDGFDTDCPDMAVAFRECLRQVHADAERVKPAEPVDAETAERLKGQLSPCISYLVSERFVKPDKTTYNQLSMMIAAYFQMAAISLTDALSMCHNFFNSCPSGVYHTPTERQKHFETIWRYVDGNPSYRFSCRYILGQSFPGYAFECSGCPMKKEKPEEPTAEADATDNRLFVHVSELIDSPARYLIKEVLEADCLAELFGAPGTYKSFVAIQIGLSIASGKDFFGYPVKDTGAAMFLIGEGISGFKRRLKAWGNHNGIDVDQLPVFVSRRPAELTVKASVETVIEGIEKALLLANVTPKLLVVDTLARNFGPADENNTGDMVRFVAGCDAIRHKHGITVLIVHHSGVIDTKRGRGNSSLYGSVDYCYRLDRTEGQKNAELVFLKVKDGDLPKPIAMEPVVVRLGIDEDGEPVTSLVLSQTDSDDWGFEMPPPRRIGAKEKAMRDTLIDMFIGRVKDGIENPAAVPETEWLAECKAAGVSRKNIFDNLSRFVVSDGIVYALSVP